jgi:anti-sigma B factor antagonist
MTTEELTIVERPKSVTVEPPHNWKGEIELTRETRDEFRLSTQAHIDYGVKQLVVDFTRTGYVDSLGISILVGLAIRLKRMGSELVLIGVNEDLETFFDHTNVASLFLTIRTKEEWLARREEIDNG